MTKEQTDHLFKLSQEVKELQKAAAIAEAKTAKVFKELAEERKKTEKAFQKTEEAYQKTEKAFQKTEAQIQKTEAQVQKTEAQVQKTEAQVQKTSKKVDEMCKLYGNASNNQGDVAEEFYFNSLGKNPILNGIKFDSVDKNMHRKRQDIEDEYDIVMINGKDIFIIEVKYKAHKKDLNTLLNKKYPNFKKLYPQYKDYKHYLGLATFHINDELKRKALESHVSVLQRSGNVIETTPAE